VIQERECENCGHGFQADSSSDRHFCKACEVAGFHPVHGKEAEADMVNHPPHYRAHPSGVECIEITEHMGFCIGNAIKYLWRADAKGAPIQDLEKAAWYIQREIERRKKA
jgi:hypothetical protein